MDDLRRLWFEFLQWMEWGIEALRSLPSDDLVASAAICALVGLLFLFARVRAVRRSRALRLRIKALEDELVVVRTAYDKEVKWRVAADRVFGQQPNRL
jgi:hypothetical protein